MALGGSLLPAKEAAVEQIIVWWTQAEEAARSEQPSRASRYLRWIVACSPDDVEAWLTLARLAPSRREQLTILQEAYIFHPDNARLLWALNRARSEQLVSTVGRLEPGISGIGATNAEYPIVDNETDHPPVGRPGVLSRVDWAGVLAFSFPLAVYLATACSTVYSMDSAEFSAAAHVLGIVRATGYPLYLLLGKLFSVIVPFGDVGFRMNVLSAVCAAAAVALLYRLILRLTDRRAAALAASLLYAFSYYFWADAVVAEVYALHALLVVVLLLLLLRWQASGNDWLLAAFALVYGLSFGNHMSSILLAPAFAAFLLVSLGPRLFSPRRLLLLALPFVLGLCVYLYIPIRYLANPAFNYAGYYDAAGEFIALDLTKPENLWWLASGKGFQGLMFNYSARELITEVGKASYWLWGTFLGVGLLPGLLGIWAQGQRSPRLLLMTGLAFAAYFAFYVNYDVIDKDTMFLPSFLIWAVWIGEGYAWLIGWVEERRAQGVVRSPGWSSSPEATRSPTWAWALASLALVALVINWSLVDVRHDTRARDQAQAALELASPDAIIFGWWTSAPPMHYLQLVENQRQDVLVVNRFLIGADEMYTWINRSLNQKQPVYVMELDEGLLDTYLAQAIGPMYELAPRQVAGANP